MSRLTDRSRALVGAGALLVVLVLWRQVVGGMQERIATADRDLPRLAADHEKVTRLLGRMRQLDRQVAEIRARPVPDGSLAAAVERVVAPYRRPGGYAGVSNPYGTAARPFDGATEEERVQVQVTGLGLTDLHDLVRGLEALGPSIRVRKLDIRKDGETARFFGEIGALRVK